MAKKISLANAPDLQCYISKDAKTTGVVLGTGAYGSVLEFKLSGASCAGKKLHDMLVDAQGEDVTAIRFKQECQLLASLRHPNIVQFLGLAFLPDSSLPCLLMERLHCSLDGYLEKQRNIPLSIKRSILLDVSSGLVYLHNEHNPPVIHRDLTSKNVLLTTSLTAKLADLGNSRFIDTARLSKTMTTAPGTSVYMPPEALQQGSHYSPKLDIFSFGHLSLYVLTETFPCDLLPPNEPDPKNPDKLIPRTEVKRREKYFSLLKLMLSQKECQPLVNLVEHCLHNSPARRPTAPELHALFESLPVDDPHAARRGSTGVEFQQEAHIYERCGEESTPLAREKMGRLSWQKLAAKRGKQSAVVLKIVKGRQLQVLNDKQSKILENVELSDVDNVETSSGKDFSFEVHFKGGKKSPWEFGALTEEECRGWMEAITCLLPGEGLHQHKKEKKNKKGHKEEKGKEVYENVQRWPVLPPLIIQPPEQTEPVAVPIYSHNSPTGQEESHAAYSLLGDFPSSPRPRANEMLASPMRKKAWEMTPHPTEPNSNVYEVMAKARPPPTPPTPEDISALYTMPRKHEKHRAQLSTDPTYDDVVQYHVPRPRAPRDARLRAREISPNRAARAISPYRTGQFFDPMQESILQRMLQQMQGYLQAECKEMPLQPSNTYLQPDSENSMTEYYVPEDMLVTDEEVYTERPQWAKASIKPVSGVTDALSKSEEESLTISPYSLSNISEIGTGQFGKVYKATLRNSDGKTIDVAVKTTKVYSEGELKNFKKEMAVMSKMMHPNIVQLYGLVQEGKLAPSIVLEFQPHGDLKTFLMENTRSQHQLMKYMVDVAMGMHYVSEKGLVHRDLAARNVLVGKNETCKVSDFGLCELPRDFSIYTSKSHTPCPLRWMAPESITKREFSTASDVWSFGVLQWEMFNPSKIPYPNMDNKLCSINVCQGYTLAIPRGCPSIVAKIMKSCWSHNPDHRPSFFLIATTLSKATL